MLYFIAQLVWNHICRAEQPWGGNTSSCSITKPRSVQHQLCLDPSILQSDSPPALLTATACSDAVSAVTIPRSSSPGSARHSRFSHQHNRATDIPTGKKSLWCCCQIPKQFQLKQVSSSPTFWSLPTGICGDDLLNKGSEFNYSSLDQFLPINTLTTATENIRLVLAYCFDF